VVMEARGREPTSDVAAGSDALRAAS